MWFTDLEESSEVEVYHGETRQSKVIPRGAT